MSIGRLRVLVVDDEPLARQGVRALLERESDIDIAGVCANGEEAVSGIRSGGVDVVFLDVEMPGMNGFDVVESLHDVSLPVIVFITAHDGYALDAFDASALDYVVKPFSDARFSTAVERARQRVAERRAAKQVNDPNGAPSGRWLDRIAIRSIGRTTFVRVKDVAWIGSADYYAELHTVDGRVHLVRESMQRLEQHLDPSQFARSHRTAIVNLDHVIEIRADGPERHVVVLRSGARVPLGKSRRRSFEGALQAHTR